MDIFDILGPVMVGPSSSHTAGAARIGAMARTLLGEEVADAKLHLYGSFAECWLLSGGNLAGITEDAVDEHSIEVDDDTALVGTVMEPNLESVAALSPDYVILSADLPAHAELDSALTDMQIPHGYFHMDNVMDYAKIMLNFCAVNDPDGEKYDENVTRVLKRIESIKQETAEKLSGQKAPTVLLPPASRPKAKTPLRAPF